jgi:hypothetical protein
MKTTVGFTSSPNVVIGDPVAGNALDFYLRGNDEYMARRGYPLRSPKCKIRRLG